MAESKRYYWLRLHDDFFASIRIKKLRKMAGGDTYVIIYLKLQLKAMKTDGVLSWKGYEQDFVDELALDIDEEPDDVRVTLAYLLACGLAESDDSVNFFFPYAVENVGSETSAAERMRKMRERNNVTPLLQDRYGEKEIEKEKEIDTREKKNKGAGRAELTPLEQAMEDFAKHRQAMRKKLTDRARELILMDLEKLAPGDDEKKIAILNQSIKQGWQGVFPLRDEQPAQRPQKSAKSGKAPNATPYDGNPEYRQKDGDSLEKLAKMYGVDI